ncbi:MAG TPA: TMEM175 family protein [Fimbriimonadaceae bacterium]|nr:TMEM175 family protein [Fimbriimonadaceae bacterium]
MHKGRLEAFSDAVIAIILTIMVLELRPPHAVTLHSLRSVLPVFCSYALSFVNLAIYWNNHHHMLQSAKHVNGAVLWANMHLLFWLSLVPFTTAWLGENELSPVPAGAYGVVLMGAGVAYFILTLTLIRANGKDSEIARALGKDFKGKISVAIYAVAIGLAVLAPAASCGLYLLVALIWLIPDRRFEPKVEG